MKKVDTSPEQDASPMAERRRTAFYRAASLSIFLSVSMLAAALLSLDLPIAPIIFLNWIAFITATWLAYQPSLLRRSRQIDRRNHNIWRVIILTFSACGFTAIGLGARMF